MPNRRNLLRGGAALAALASMSRVAAQSGGNAFIVSGFPAGGMGDHVARPLAERLRGKYAPTSWSRAGSAPAAASRSSTSSARHRTD